MNTSRDVQVVADEIAPGETALAVSPALLLMAGYSTARSK